jgi:hypothetical protein
MADQPQQPNQINIEISEEVAEGYLMLILLSSLTHMPSL